MLRLSELYVSSQGEGPNVGKLTTFVRFAGCNMRCPSWPCDTPHAIFPEIYNKEMEAVSWNTLVERIQELPAKHLCLTGGEPFLQFKSDLILLAENLRALSYTMDIFTNGSFIFPMFATEPSVTVVMDWKLIGSGEAGTAVANREFNRQNLLSKDAIKFTVANQADMEEAISFLYKWRPYKHQVFMGPVWGQIEPEDVVDFIRQSDFPDIKLNVQVHKYVWEPMARRT